MTNDEIIAINFEIAWRELLIKKLTYVQTKLNKETTAQVEAKRARQSELRSLYPSAEAAHEAYGWGFITEDEWREIEQELESVNASTEVSAARDELKSFITRLRREIRDLKWELLPQDEQERIRKSRERMRKRENVEL
jgi:hypothetical protein